MKVVALAGGTGSAKLLRGLAHLGPDLTVVSNVGDNFRFHGILVCPDLDVATYVLGGVADKKKGWGVAGDTFAALGQLERLGAPTWFRLGDLDLATCLFRGGMIEKGLSLTEATEVVRRSLGVRAKVLPVTDDDVQTHIRTPRGLLHLQEFWVRDGGRPKVLGVEYSGSESARLTPGVALAMEAADRIVICPANPITSVGPMLAVPGFERLLSSARERVSALSPMVGSAPYSGPAGKLMRAAGLRPDSVGVASAYAKFLGTLLVARVDSGLVPEVEAMGIRCHATDALIGSPAAAKRVAKELLAV